MPRRYGTAAASIACCTTFLQVAVAQSEPAENQAILEDKPLFEEGVDIWKFKDLPATIPEAEEAQPAGQSVDSTESNKDEPSSNFPRELLESESAAPHGEPTQPSESTQQKDVDEAAPIVIEESTAADATLEPTKKVAPALPAKVDSPATVITKPTTAPIVEPLPVVEPLPAKPQPPEATEARAPLPNPSAKKAAIDSSDGEDDDEAIAGQTPSPTVNNQSIVQFQKFTHVETRPYKTESGNEGSVTLTNLNTNINNWYLLTIDVPNDQKNNRVFHLETAEFSGANLSLTTTVPAQLSIKSSGAEHFCSFWNDNEALKKRSFDQPYLPLCNHQLLLRSQVQGHQTTKEWFVDLLRDRVWGGEEITTFVKENFFKDKFLINDAGEVNDADIGADGAVDPNVGPMIAKIEESEMSKLLLPKDLAIDHFGGKEDKMYAGRWYRSKADPGIYVSVMQPRTISREILESTPGRASNLDETEGNSLNYLIAFDLSRFDLHYALGTDHPRVDWSDRVLSKVRDDKLKGPDGFDTTAPLVATGMVKPNLAPRTVATFTGGFKRTHGAFKWGALSLINHGSHYGFIESGVVYSSLVPGLATILMLDDGRIDMKTWHSSESSLLPRVRHARQNGVALVEWDEATGASIPGKFVNRWGRGNWSGSQDSKLRTLRAGLCWQVRNQKQFLIYGYFSSVTPSAMARVFQSYSCRFAMHLDMNALEHTYLSVLSSNDKGFKTENLIGGMKVLDKEFQKKTVPRFIGFADNRDFFYLIRKD